MFYKYTNVPIKLNDSGFFCTNVSIQEQANLSPLYLANDRHSKTYVPSDGINGVLSLTYYLTGTDYLKDYLVKETGVISGNIGGLYFHSGYLKSYNLNCLPNKPISTNAEIAFFDEIKGEFRPSYINPIGETPVLNFSDITITDPSNGNIGSISNIKSLNYSFSSDVQPLFVASDDTPTKISFGKKDISAVFVCDNLSGNLPISGLAAGIKINFSHPYIPGLGESFTCSGKLYQRDITTSVGSLLQSQLSIRQNYIDDPPTITSISSATVVPGNYIRFQGKGFNTVSEVFFNDSRAEFFIVSDILMSGVVPDDVISGDIKVSNAAGTTTGGFYTVNHLPITVTSLIPTTGQISGRIHISGTNFHRITDVKFTNNVSADYTVLSTGLIEAVVPLNANWGTVRVISTTRNISGESTQLFVPFPRIDGFTPASGISGRLITISGYAFSGVTGLLFNNLPNLSPFTASFGVIGNTGITGQLPTGNTKGYIKLLGQSGVVTTSVKTFYPIINITGISPTTSRTGLAIDFLGENFLSDLMKEITANKFLVGFNQVTGTFNKVNDGRLTGLIPYNAKSGPVYIYDSSYRTYPSNVNFTLINEVPTISYISPNSGLVSGFTTIYGTNFYNVTGTKISGLNVITTLNNPSPSIGELGDTITFKIPQVTGDIYTLIVQTSGGGDVTGNGLLTILGSGIFSGFNVTSGAIGQRIIITGKNFYNNSKVYFNFTGITGETSIDNTAFNALNSQAAFYVPFQAQTGLNTVFLYNSVNYVTGANFRLIERPRISGFNPLSGDYGVIVSITGVNMGNVTGVGIGTGITTSYTPINNTGVTFTVPTDASTDFITIYSMAGNDTSTTKFGVLLPLPTFSGFYPLSGNYGDAMVISGLRLNTVTEILFTGTTSGSIISSTGNSFTISGTTGIHFNLPAGVSGGPFQLRNSRGLTGSTNSFLIIPTPGVSGFTPVYGKFEDYISVSGSNLGGMQFLFQGVNSGTWVNALNITTINQTGATIQVPKEIVQGQIIASGRGINYGGSTGFFTPLPTISGIHFESGLTGSRFTITGINAAQLLDVIFLTGAGTLTEIQSGNFVYKDLSNISGAGITNYTTGYTIISGTLNENAAGTGNLILVNQYYSFATTPSNYLTGEFSNSTSSIKSSQSFSGIESTPVITTYDPGSGNSNTTLTLSGFGLANTTGIYFLSGSYRQTGIIQSKATHYVVVTPPGNYIERSGSIQLFTSYGNATYTKLFTFIDSPFISGFHPIQSTTGNYIRITGSGMRDITGVYFGNNIANFITGTHGGTYVCSGLVPYFTETLPYQVNIKVYNHGGNSTSSTPFTILKGPQQFIGNVEISSGLSITGDLSVLNNVQIGGNLLTSGITSLDGDLILTGNLHSNSGRIYATGYELKNSTINTGNVLYSSYMLSGFLVVTISHSGTEWRALTKKF